MRALNWYIREMAILEHSYRANKITITQYLNSGVNLINTANKMAEKELKEAYQDGRNDENCDLTGDMMPSYDTADEWYAGEYPEMVASEQEGGIK